MAGNNSLHLPDLTIRGFRGIDELTIPRLGRVTLLAGKNSVGKTTVLDAVRVYAARGRYSTLYELLTLRDEVIVAVDEDGDQVIEPSWSALFHGRHSPFGSHIEIGPENLHDRLTIGTTFLTDQQISLMENVLGEHLADDRLQAFRIQFKGIGRHIPLNRPYRKGARNYVFHRGIGDTSNEDELPPAIVCVSLGPGLLGNEVIGRYWDEVALTEYETHAVRSLGLIFGGDVDRVAVIGDDQGVRRLGGRRVMVKLKSYDQPVPLKSLGDGALRMFGAALALANSRDGFLLIDEAENGIHHSVQQDYWRMILRSAQQNNVQVIATTHSWDCVRGFAQASAEAEDADGVLVRLSRQYGDLRAVEYSEKNLKAAAEQGIEVR